MKDAIRLYTVLILVFVLLLVAAGSIGGTVGQCVRMLAYIIPIAVGYFSAPRFRRERENVSGVVEEQRYYLGIGMRGVRLALPLIFPTVAVVFTVSAGTSALLGLIGAGQQVTLGGSLLDTIIMRAIVPAVMEELLFRYLPMLLLMPYGRRECVLISSLYFALVHCDLFSIPYALVAGLVFIVIDMATESVLPSVVLHLVNNLLSVLWMYWSADATLTVVYIAGIFALAAVGTVVIILRRKDYGAAVSSALARGEGVRTAAPFALIIPTLLVAVMSFAELVAA